MTLGGQANYTWLATTADTRGLQKPAPATDRLAATWYGSTFTMDVAVGSATKRVSLYMLDWDNAGRSQRVDVLDAVSGAVLDTRTVSSFRGGTWLSWTLTGAVRFRFTSLAGPNAVVSGIFFSTPPGAGSTSASYVGSNTTTGGTWQGAYGADGYALAQSGTSLPSYATMTLGGQAELYLAGHYRRHTRVAEASSGH